MKNITPSSETWVDPKSYKLAVFIHDRYEHYAAIHGWKTNETCRVPFDNLPIANKKTMIDTAKELIKKFDL